jgi:hypothetical protein
MSSNGRRPSSAIDAVLIGCAILAAGCSLAGLGIGAIHDSHQKTVNVPGWQIETVGKDRDVILTLADGSTVPGKVKDFVAEPPEQYRTRYDSCRVKEPAPKLPALGPGATLKARSGAVAHGDLIGFDSGVVLLVEEGHTGPARVAFDVVESLSDGQGVTLAHDEITRMASAGAIPLRTTIVLGGEPGTRRVPLDQVHQVIVPAKRHGKLIGFVIGAAIDAVILATLAADDDQPPPPDPNYNSCPFVYSYDGSGFVLDAEVFGGALFEKAQRTDFARLARLQPSNGALRVRITNELRETQYVDSVSLVVADHAPGSRVVSTFSGELLELNAPREARFAADLAGRNVTDLVARRDGRSWVSNPFGRDPEDEGQLRDGLVLEFARPSGSGAATLALTVTNTGWASYLQGQLLELLGSDVDAWYTRMDASPEARDQLQAAMLREGMLRVSVWDGADWTSAGYVWEVGPSVARNQAVRLDLNGIPGERLRVKLDATAGLWMVDDVVVDFAARTLPRSELSVAAARDQDGRDLHDVLTASDGHRYVMASREDWAELSFTAPPAVAGGSRSVFVKSSGYYHIHASGRGESQAARLERLLTEPGAYGRYTLALLNGRSQGLLRTAAAH